MTKQIETRCAVVMGCEVDSSGWVTNFGAIPFEPWKQQYGWAKGKDVGIPRRLHINQFAFTTDRNWCQLLVDELDTDELYTAFIHELMSKSMFTGIDDILKATPLQIATAALETLEGESENE